MQYFATQDTNLQQLFDGAQDNSTIYLEEGTYRQKVEINKSLTIIGKGANTVIVWDDYAKKIGEDGLELVTFRTYTVSVCADNVTLKNLTIANDSGDSPTKGQEVALTVYGDNFVAENCTFVSEQDTLFCGPLPDDLIERYDGFLKDKLRKSIKCKQIYTNCTLKGTVDFIFGCGDCLFENCTIVYRKDSRKGGFIVAPAHAESQQIGMVFYNCNFTKEEGVLEHSIYLARPWRDYGKTSFVNCHYDSHVTPLGFDKWNDTNRDKTARFAEYGNTQAGRVSWSKILSTSQAQQLLAYFNRELN
ncbi:MAG: pectin esterase [Clostridia bacterium]|nr:pectin esterase [Clostridia bacterium]